MIDDIIVPKGILAPEWRDIFMKFSGRIMVGTDTYTAERWKNYPRIKAQIRDWLCQLPEPVANNLSWSYAQRLLNRNHKP